MNREELLYNKIMQEIAITKQDKSMLVKTKEFTLSYNDTFTQLFSFSDKLALVAVAIICLSVNAIHFELNSQEQADFYTTIYDTEY